MKFTITEDSGGARSAVCWRAITAAVDHWEAPVPNATLQARFNEEGDELTFTLNAPGTGPQAVTVDVSWIAYADHADRLAFATRQGLGKFEDAFVAPR